VRAARFGDIQLGPCPRFLICSSFERSQAPADVQLAPGCQAQAAQGAGASAAWTPARATNLGEPSAQRHRWSCALCACHYLARLRHGENRHLARLSSLYGLGGLDRRTGTATGTAIGVDTQSSAPPPQLDSADAGDDAGDTADATDGEADWA
jgi:hypothetical protein